MPLNDDLRAELAEVAASLRAYLEVQADSGATGIPRPRAIASPVATATASPTATESSSANVTATARPTASPTAIASSSPMGTAPATVTSPPDERRRALTLVQLAEQVSSCTRCDLHKTRTQTVFARGNAGASLCFVGEAPGADEDAQGVPFVGRAGQLLDRMIQAMGLSPEKDVYICNIIKCRPPDNRRPEPEETAACIPYLHEQLESVHPRVIVALGNTAVSILLNTKVGITKLRGQWKLYRGATLVMPTYHPSYLLRPSPQQAEAKRQAWDDLRAVMGELKIPLPAKPGGQ
jgi:uracil-DNA glycosylase